MKKAIVGGFLFLGGINSLTAGYSTGPGSLFTLFGLAASILGIVLLIIAYTSKED